MNPIEKDIKFFYDVDDETDSLEHYGTKRHSGRYPWGSGENPYQRSGDFLSRVEELKKTGKFTEKEILEQINATLPDEYKMGTTEFRVAQQKALHERKALQYDQIRALKDDGLKWTEIGEKLGLSESTVRSMYNNGIGEKANQAQKIAETLKAEVDKKGMIDVSEGTNLVLGVSEGKLDEAIYILEAEHGYQRYGVGIRQPTNINQQTNVTVLAKPEYNQKYAYEHQGDIQSLGDYHSDDGGETFQKLQRPSSMSSDRVAIRYGDEGGLDKDGVIEIRRGVDDLSLGNSHYAQVRIMVDNSHYLKGMAVYSDDVPDGYDVIFNTNKPSGTPKMKVLKPIKDDPDNPFGAALTAAGQSEYIGADGKKHLSPINKLREEGEWDTMAKNLSSQFLSKQPIKLIKQQLNLTLADRKAEYEEIMNYDNPTIKKKLLIDFADTCEGNSMTLKASSFPGQSTKVILPLTKISEKECYCPTYENGTQLALIRYPHAGTFEIPIVTVNNKNVSGKRNFGNIQDAIGINSKVAERLSGADFDGDTVVAIPISSKVAVKATAALRDLKDFDPKTAYAVPEGNPNGVRLMKKEEKQKEMGIISNLITDMTLRGADEKEIARAVKHSMVVIDAEKHKLDYKRSERENGIQELKKKWQIRVDEDGNEHFGGASTLLSRRKQTVYVPERKGSVRIDKETGELIYKESGRRYFDKEKGEFVDAQQKHILGIHSPSKVMAGIGEYVVEGLTRGIVSTEGEAEKGMDEVGGAVIRSALATTNAIADHLSTDNHPSITPVVDLSDASRSSAWLNSAFADRKGTISMAATVTGRMARRAETPSRNQNGYETAPALTQSNRDVVEAVKTLGERIDRVAESVKGMKVVMNGRKFVGEIRSDIDDVVGDIIEKGH